MKINIFLIIYHIIQHILVRFPPFANDLFWKAFSKYKTKQNLLRLIFNVRYTSMPRILEVEEDELLKVSFVSFCDVWFYAANFTKLGIQ